MYQKGEYIIYGNTGVCRVEDVAVPDNIPIKEKGALYYKLSPVYGAGSIYIPVDTEVFMRPVLTKAQANELIDKMYDGSPDLLVASILGNKKLKHEEIVRLKKLVEDLK